MDFAFTYFGWHHLADNEGYFKQMTMFNKSIGILSIIFFVTTIVILVFRNLLHQHGFSWNVLFVGNVVVFLVTAFSVLFLSKALRADTTAQFLQHTYVSILLKLFVCGIVAFVYIFTHKSHINKRALFACMGLYLVYTFIERRIIMKYSKERKNENKASA